MQVFFRHKAIAHLTDYRLMKTQVFSVLGTKASRELLCCDVYPADLELTHGLSLSSACLCGHDISSAGLSSPGCAQTHKSGFGWDMGKERSWP